MAGIDSELEFCNAALARASVSVISSFEGGKGPEAKAIYDVFEKDVLALAFWRCNTGTRQLVRLTASPDVRWDYQFQLPEDRLDYPRAVYDSATTDFPTGDYELGEDRLYGNFEECWVWYQRRLASPAHWSVSLRSAAVVALAAQYALTFNEDRSRFQTLMVEAYGSLDASRLGGRFGLAIQKEALSAPPEQAMPDGGPLLAARMGGW